jgi:nucleotide-binding universal stress UspA family protein
MPGEGEEDSLMTPTQLTDEKLASKMLRMKFSRILVPVTGTQADEEAIELACRLAKPDKSEIYVICIIAVKRELPVNADLEAEIQNAEGILVSMEKVARRENYKIETEVLQAREPGPAIVSEAIERRIDMILLGLIYKVRFGEFSLGEVVPYVLKNSPCRVMLYQSSQPIGQEDS